MDLLERHFDTAFAAPDGIKKLRELVFALAMQGKLVPQDPKDPPVSELLKGIEAEKKRLLKEGKSKGSIDVTSIGAKDIPYMIPEGWTWVRLGQVCSYIQRGKGPKYIDDSPYRVVSQKCVRWWGLDLEPARCIEPESLNSYEPIRFLLSGDLLWNSTGTGTIGRACLVPAGFEGDQLVMGPGISEPKQMLVSDQI